MLKINISHTSHRWTSNTDHKWAAYISSTTLMPDFFCNEAKHDSFGVWATSVASKCHQECSRFSQHEQLVVEQKVQIEICGRIFCFLSSVCRECAHSHRPGPKCWRIPLRAISGIQLLSSSVGTCCPAYRPHICYCYKKSQNLVFVCLLFRKICQHEVWIINEPFVFLCLIDSKVQFSILIEFTFMQLEILYIWYFPSILSNCAHNTTALFDQLFGEFSICEKIITGDIITFSEKGLHQIHDNTSTEATNATLVFSKIWWNIVAIFAVNLSKDPKFDPELIRFAAHILCEFTPRFCWK